ncbi:MAG: diaminopimelate epimerase, partial [Lachnospiraceae bacterium]|nr:diaminopimelate epimerase [Lachnospiraceae bacterium]
MRFTKMEGCGNDYIYVDITEQPLRDPAAFAVKYSDRHFGIGSDGLITIGRSENADFFMRIYNADGSEGTMCGNGIRCVAKYVYDKGLTDRDEISVETLGGIKVIRMNIEDGEAVSARVDMGVPSLRAADVPVVFPGPDGKPLSEVKAEPVRIAGRDWEMTCVSVGN